MNPVYTDCQSMLSVLFIGGYGWVVVSVLRAGSFSADVKEVLIFCSAR